MVAMNPWSPTSASTTTTHTTKKMRPPRIRPLRRERSPRMRVVFLDIETASQLNVGAANVYQIFRQSTTVSLPDFSRRLDMETGCVLVCTTVQSQKDAAAIASTLVNERLAACVNVLGEMESTYRWKGAVETERERQLIIKTTEDRLSLLRTRLHELHPYELPEFITFVISGGSENYLTWLRQSTE